MMCLSDSSYNQSINLHYQKLLLCDLAFFRLAQTEKKQRNNAIKIFNELMSYKYKKYNVETKCFFSQRF